MTETTLNRHSTGPWLAATKPSRVVGWPIVQQGTGRLICNINYIQTTSIEPRVGGEGKFNKESEANAHLIAAPPDLLEALKDLSAESAETFAHWPDLKRQVDAAIAKAVRA